MRVCERSGVRCVVLMAALCTMLGGVRLQAQDKQHVVSSEELSNDTARVAQTRQANEAAVRRIFSSEQAQNALKAAKIDYAKVDQAIGQISDEELAKLAERSRQVQNNFSAGSSISDRDLLIILIVAILLIAIIAIAR